MIKNCFLSNQKVLYRVIKKSLEIKVSRAILFMVIVFQQFHISLYDSLHLLCFLIDLNFPFINPFNPCYFC
jgi:hypothetical protein